MKVKYLGTAAAECWPAVFCKCEACEKARKRGGKNIRRRAQVLINDDMMVDLNADNYSFSLTYNIDLSKIKFWLITHSHSDHCMMWDLEMRGSWFAHDMSEEITTLFVNHRVEAIYKKLSDDNFLDEVKAGIHCQYVQPYVPFQAGTYTITPLLANHNQGEDSYIYIIEQDGKRLLYANDTGLFPQTTTDYLMTLTVPFDLVSMDCTSGPMMDGGGHMGYPENVLLRKKLEEMGLADSTTQYVLTHFSHNSQLIYDELADFVKGSGFIVAYDGMEIEI